MKLPSLYPVVLFAGGILLSIELKILALPSPRIYVFAVFVLLVTGCILHRKNWMVTAAVLAASA
jgi:hypothetical protein